MWVADEPALERTDDLLPQTTVSLAKGSVIRAAPAGPIIATTLVDGVAITTGPTRDGWTTIDMRRPYARIHGVVLAASIGTGPTGIHTVGGGSGFGISDTEHVALPAGACLFDAPEQDTIGVNLKAIVRYAHRPTREHPGWWSVYVGSPWAILSVFAHDLGSDPNAPRWDLCGKR